MKSKASSRPFPQQAFSYLAAAESRHWWFVVRNQIIIWVLRRKTSNLKRFLEVGCGTGYVLSGIAKAFPALTLEASEYFEDGLMFARQRLPNCRFRQLDATLMADQDKYDCIGCFDVLEHINSDELVLSNFKRALHSGGFLLLTVPQHRWLWSAADDFAHHVRRYTHHELRQKVINAGFEIVYSTSFVSLLLPAMAFQRLSARNSGYNPDDEFRGHPAIDLLLYLVMQIEFALLRVGLRFPMGGSLLLLARKP